MKKSLVFLNGFIFLFCLVGASYATPTYYNPTTNHYYEVVTGNWLQAEDNAQLKGGHLVTINNHEEELWLQANFGYALYWIGFYDSVTEGTWEWVSGESSTYTNWAIGEPNNAYGKEDWAAMNYSSDEKWNDYDVGNLCQGIAEWAAAPVPEPATCLLFLVGIVGIIGIKKKCN